MADVKEEPPDDSGADDEIVRIDDEDGNVDGEDQIVILEYEQNLMVDTMEDDVLFITGRGLGLERLFLHHLAMYSDQKLLVFVLNTSQQDESFFLSRLREMAKGEGNAPPKLINADVPTKDRESIYLEGGVQFITSRILLVDLLCGRVPEEHVAGIVVWRAHHVLTSFQESFILRIYRERKKDGFVKAFSDFPTTLSSLGELQRLVSRLYVRRVRIVPRFDTDVKRSFDKAPLPSSELVVDLPPLLRRCLSTLVELIKVCGRELKATVAGRQKKDTSGEEAEEESMAGVAYAPTALEKEIADKRSFATEKQQRLLSDLAQLRDLLRTAEDIDACTMMTKIQAMRTERERSEDAPAWMLSSLAQRLFGDVETLAGAGKQKDSAQFQPPPKWTAYAQVLEEIAASPVPPECTEKGPAVLVFTSDDVLTRQLSDLTRVGCDRMAQMVRSQVPGASYGRSPTAPFGPMWPHDDVTTFMRNQEDHGELIKTLQTNQKTAARATKRRRAVAEGMMSTRDGGVQTTILQFGILHHKKKRSRRGARGDEEEEVDPEAPSTSGPLKDEDEEDGEASRDGPKLIRNTKVPLVIAPHGQRYNIIRQLETLVPTHIICYNSEVATIRQIELFHAINSERPLKVYILQYHNSTEEERYLSALSREQMAFEALTREMQSLLVSRIFDVAREAPPKTRLNLLGTKSSRIGGGDIPADEAEEEERPKIIVDMREFASELPTVLYKKGYDVVAATLEVGDYVLTPDTVVERKALDDLTQSLQSGRVFKQTEQMLRHYSTVILLVESSAKFEARIVNGGPFQGELSRHCRDIRLQLCVLIRRFPRLRLIWAADPENSADFFTELKMNKDEPDVAAAISLHGDDAVDATVDGDFPSTSKAVKEKKPNAVLMRVLCEAMPFLGSGDVKKLMLSDRIKCLKDLFKVERQAIVEILGETNADKIDILRSFDFSAGD